MVWLRGLAWMGAFLVVAVALVASMAGATNHPRFNSVVTQGRLMGPGDTFVHTFSQSGTFSYHSTGYGEDVKGAVLVHESYVAQGTVDVEIRDGGFHADVVYVAPGDAARWTNKDSLNHSLHEDGDSPGPALLPESATPSDSGAGGGLPGPSVVVVATLAAGAAWAIRRRA